MVAAALVGFAIPSESATGAPRPQRQRLHAISNGTVESRPRSVDSSEAMVASDVYSVIKGIFSVADDVLFENGFESDFSQALARAICVYGDSAIAEVDHLIRKKCVRQDVAEEALRVIGRISHESSRPYRKWLLERELVEGNAATRDAASLGIADMDDPSSIPALERAIALEPSDILREDLRMVLRQLQSHGTATAET